MLSAASATWSFSTAGLPPRDRASALHGLRERGILPLEPLPGLLAQAEIAKWNLPGIRVLSGTLGGLRQIASPHDLGVSDDVFLGVHLAGESAVRHLGHELTLRSGEAVLFSCADRGFIAHRPTPVQFLGIRLLRRDLATLAPNLDDAVMRLIPRQTDPLRLLATYLRCMGAEQRPISPELGHAVAAHLLDLIALSVGASRDTIAAAQARGVRAARVLAIKADIVRNLADPSLTVSAVAARHGVTPRYVHKLFESEGVTFSEYVLGRRLATAHRLLIDWRLGTRSITSIALGVGFSDLSYFNRTFRRQYHATPTEVRFRGRG
jgi:AraC-like DNA-binding protein